MTNANMKLVVINVKLSDYPSSPKAKLDEGEHIVKRIVELDRLNDELKGKDRRVPHPLSSTLKHFCQHTSLVGMQSMHDCLTSQPGGSSRISSGRREHTSNPILVTKAVFDQLGLRQALRSRFVAPAGTYRTMHQAGIPSRGLQCPKLPLSLRPRHGLLGLRGI